MRQTNFGLFENTTGGARDSDFCEVGDSAYGVTIHNPRVRVKRYLVARLRNLNFTGREKTCCFPIRTYGSFRCERLKDCPTRV